jgi:cell envelope opacity-associated protein A
MCELSDSFERKKRRRRVKTKQKINPKQIKQKHHKQTTTTTKNTHTKNTPTTQNNQTNNRKQPKTSAHPRFLPSKTIHLGYSTGAAHWEVLLRARAIENQCFVAAAAQCGQHNAFVAHTIHTKTNVTPNNANACRKRASYGHSLIIDPWGKVLASLENEPGLAVADLDFSLLDQVCF